MDIHVKVVNEKLICCKYDHNEPIIMVAVDQGIPQSEMLLCIKCFQPQIQPLKYISFEEAQTIIYEKHHKLTHHQKEILLNLNEFQSKMMKIKSRVLQQIDEILGISQQWITDITNIERKPDVNNFLQDLKLLQQDDKVNQLDKNTKCHLLKIYLNLKNLINIDDYLNCQN